jgi:exodeoxyribonuclease V gamma subunit
MAIHLFTSNKQEILLSAFSEICKTLGPLQTRNIVTPGRGIRNWIKQELARKNGISANLQFFSPEQVVWQFGKILLPKNFTIIGNPFSKERMAWRIREVLPGLISDHPDEFNLIISYLEDGDPLKRIQLCWEIAGVFDGYLNYRPEMISKWSDGKILTQHKGNEWQSILWKRIESLMPCPPLSNLIKERDYGTQGVEPVFVFGMGILPPLHLHAFLKKAQTHEVFIFMLQPTDTFWDDILSSKNKTQLDEQTANNRLEEWSENGPPLLGALGKGWQKTIRLLDDLDRFDPQFLKDPDAKEVNSSLSALQDCLMKVETSNHAKSYQCDPKDKSIQFHSCHGKLREIQALNDFLLDQFNQPEPPHPREVLVLCPQLENYSALIRAVFDNPESEEMKIPYGLCDRDWRSESRIMDTFYHLLEFSESRATARDFFTLISRPPIRDKFELDDQDLETIKWWLEKTNVAWGFDRNHKQSLDLPPEDQNTWENALDRLMLGFCSGKETLDGFDDLFAVDEIEGNKLDLFSKLADLVNSLKDMQVSFSRPQKPAAWKVLIFKKCLDVFFDDNKESHADLVEIRKSLDFLVHETNSQTELEPLSVIRWHLEKTLREKSLFSRHLTHGVTFCSMRSGRGIPAKVICVIGLNGGEFPSSNNRTSFDLSRQFIKPTDRNISEEDRLLLLETILCARECLYFSYKGQSDKNNEEIPASVVVDEIKEQIDAIIALKDSSVQIKASEYFTYKHPLQAFGRSYFTESSENEQSLDTKSPKPKSFSVRNCEAARTLMQPKKDPTPFVTKDVEGPCEDQQSAISLRDLVKFWQNPSAYFISRQLDICIWDQENLLPENERLDASPLEDSKLKNIILNYASEAETTSFNEDINFEKARKAGLLLPGQLGTSLYSSLHAEVSALLARSGEDFSLPPKTQSSRGMIGGYEIEGKITSINYKQLILSSSKLKGKHCMEGLVLHLFANLFGQQKGVFETIICATDRTYILKPPKGNACMEALEYLVKLFVEGRKKPIPFFPNCTLAWMTQAAKLSDEKSRARKSELSCAYQSWSSEFGGEGKEFSNKICFPQNPWKLDETIELNKLVVSHFNKLGGVFL